MCDKILNLCLILFFTVIIECTDAPSNLAQNSIRKPPSCRPNDHSSRMNIAGITPAQWVPTMLREVIEPPPVSGWEISLLAHLLTLLWHFFPGLYFLKYTCIGKFYSLCTIGPNISVYQSPLLHIDFVKERLGSKVQRAKGRWKVWKPLVMHVLSLFSW